MFTISQKVMDVFTQRAIDNYIERLLPHLRESFPERCEALGEVGVRNAVRDEIESAGRYSITLEPTVAQYVHLGFLFGPGFDRDPACPWAQEVLNDKTIVDEQEKMDALYARAEAAIDAEPEDGDGAEEGARS